MGPTAKQRCANCGSRCRLVAALVALAVWSTVGAAPIPQLTAELPTDFGREDALIYLHRYGYLNDSDFNASSTQEESFKEALTVYQEFSSLPITGKLDAATIQQMLAPRCGVKDINPQEHERSRQKRYNHIGTRFLKQHLTYSLNNAPPRWRELTMREAMDALEHATAMWAAVTPVTFSRAPRGSIANIDFSFRSRDERPKCDYLDGPGRVLAHATPPVFDKAIIHFDADEKWTPRVARPQEPGNRWRDRSRGWSRGWSPDRTGDRTRDDINFYHVAAHELGHALGLHHTFKFRAVMGPWYFPTKDLKLHADDIDGIQALYGSRDEPQSFLRWLKNVTIEFIRNPLIARRIILFPIPKNSEQMGTQ